MTKKETQWFPLLQDLKYNQTRDPDAPELIKGVPWDFIGPYGKSMYEKHGQTPEKLASRGGLDVRELMYVITNDRNWLSRPILMAQVNIINLLKDKGMIPRKY